MELPLISVLAFSLLVTVALIMALQNQRRRALRLRKRFRNIEGEEQRMFSFLHDLGLAIENEPSPALLSRIIVDGIDKVVSARGGAIYFVSDDGAFLNPAYVAEDCPPLTAVPPEVRARAARDPRALDSHIRLTRVPVDEGILGHGLQAGEALHIHDLQAHPSVGEAAADCDSGVEVLVAPLRHAGKNLGVLAVARREEDGVFCSNDFAVFRAVSEQASFAIGNARIHREANEKRVLERELLTAREVQRILLPQADPQFAGFRISGTNLPARIISGDYYDYIDVGEGRLGIVIADVSGKGVPAGLLMAMCRSALRSVAPGESSPSKVLAAVNRQLFPDIREDMFVSMAYAILEAGGTRLTLARAGHDPALCFRQDEQTVESLRSPGLALGIDSGDVFERVTRDQVVELGQGDCILFYTDGVKEAIDERGDEFGIERMSEVFRAASALGAEAVVRRMQEELRDFTGESPQMDDITLVAIEKR